MNAKLIYGLRHLIFILNHKRHLDTIIYFSVFYFTIFAFYAKIIVKCGNKEKER